MTHHPQHERHKHENKITVIACRDRVERARMRVGVRLRVSIRLMIR